MQNRGVSAVRARPVCYAYAMTNVELIEGADATAVASWVERQLRTALADTQSDVVITVPGGSTPFPIFEALTKRDLDWQRVVVWPGDDRVVPEQHPASNTGKMRQCFEPVGAKVEPLQPSSNPPRFALAWLGMGGDGHIASLFPNTDPQADDCEQVRSLTPDPLPPEADPPGGAQTPPGVYRQREPDLPGL